jgi:hypothetical protein
MNFIDATKIYNELNLATDNASKALKVFPKGAMGLTPDNVRATPEYKAARMAYDAANAKSRVFNTLYNKAFKKELSELRRARRTIYYLAN